MPSNITANPTKITVKSISFTIFFGFTLQI